MNTRPPNYKIEHPKFYRDVLIQPRDQHYCVVCGKYIGENNDEITCMSEYCDQEISISSGK